MTALWRGM